MASDLTNPIYIRALMKKYGLDFSKSLGQNFICDGSICPKMAQMSGIDKNMCVIEIGPGAGALTRELSKRAKKVLALEIDRALFPLLSETLSDCPNVLLLCADIMKTDIRKLIAEKFDGEEVCVCANLPYYITSPILMRLLEEEKGIKSITVMVQKEAARRFCAAPGSRDCGAVSVSVHYHSKPELLFEVDRNKFLPPPKVDSSVIRFDILKAPPVNVDDEGFFFKMSRGAFAQRRKTAANSISASCGIEKNLVEAGLEYLGLPQNIRAERMTLQNLSGLANFLFRWYNKKKRMEEE